MWDDKDRIELTSFMDSSLNDLFVKNTSLREKNSITLGQGDAV